VAAKKKSTGLPVNPKALLEAIGLIEKESTSTFELAVFVDTSVDPALLAYAKEAFRPQAGSLNITVTPYADEGGDTGDTENAGDTGGAENTGSTDDPFSCLAEGALVVLLAAESALTGQLLARARERQLAAVVMTLDPVRLQQIARDNYSRIDALSIVTAAEYVDRRGGEDGIRGDGHGNDGHDGEVRDGTDSQQERFARLFAALGDWMVRKLPDAALSLARALRFVRGPYITSATQATSLQNAAIAAVFFLPGADMPLLTLNQMKLFLKIAAVYDATLDGRRLQELAVLLLGGFGFRALARRLVGVVPVLGWAIRGGIGYTGTLAVGAAAHEYFEKGGDLRKLVRGLGRGETTENSV
jgi:uncharacterized protein (DUF697 family)